MAFSEYLCFLIYHDIRHPTSTLQINVAYSQTFSIRFQLITASWKLGYSYSCQKVDYSNDPDEIRVYLLAFLCDMDSFMHAPLTWTCSLVCVRLLLLYGGTTSPNLWSFWTQFSLCYARKTTRSPSCMSTTMSPCSLCGGLV